MSIQSISICIYEPTARRGPLLHLLLPRGPPLLLPVGAHRALPAGSVLLPPARGRQAVGGGEQGKENRTRAGYI